MKKISVFFLVLGAVFAQGSRATVIDAVEYYHAQFDHYFITADAPEIAFLDGGAFGGAWKRTGESFKVESTALSGTATVCRFFSTTFSPKSSHFYTGLSSECAVVKANPNWQFESNAFFVTSPNVSGTCASGSKVYRLYNNGQGGAPNHRFTTSSVTRSQMLAKGWIAEGYGDGVTFCTAVASAPPPSLALTKTNALLGGVWHFTYIFGSTYNDTFRFTTVGPNSDPGTMASTPYFAYGVNKYNQPVTAAYTYLVGKVLLLSPLASFYDAYMFDYTGPDSISGCYDFDSDIAHLFDHCSALVGFRSASLTNFEPKSAVDEVSAKIRQPRTVGSADALPSVEALKALRQ